MHSTINYNLGALGNVNVRPYHRTHPKLTHEYPLFIDRYFPDDPSDYNTKIPSKSQYTNQQSNSVDKLVDKAYVDAYPAKPTDEFRDPYLPNDKILSETSTSYVNIDSAQRFLTARHTYDPNIYSLPEQPIKFTNGSKKLIISFPQHPFQVGERITLSNVFSKNTAQRGVVSVKKNSYFMKIRQLNHKMTFYGLYDPQDETQFEIVSYVEDLPQSFQETTDIPDTSRTYYVLKTNNCMGYYSVTLNGFRSAIGNIPANFLNGRHTVYLSFYKNGSIFVSDPNYYLIRLDSSALINYSDEVSNKNTIMITYNQLFGIPLYYLNADLPLDDTKKIPFFTIIETQIDNFTVETLQPAIVDPFVASNVGSTDSVGGGNQVFVRKVSDTAQSYPNVSDYLIELDRTYKNVIQVGIADSIFPLPCYLRNKKFYWRNLIDGDTIYNITVDVRVKNIKELINVLMDYINKTPRGISDGSVEFDSDGNFLLNLMKIERGSGDKITFSSFSKKIIKHPEVLISTLNVTMAENLQKNFGKSGTGIVSSFIKPFDPKTESLFFYLSPNSLTRIQTNLRLNDMYEYNDVTKNTNGFTSFRIQLNMNRAILFNFVRDKQVYPITKVTQEVRSFNTSTLLTSFSYDPNLKMITLFNHQLKEGDILVTDKFLNDDVIHVFQIKRIISTEKVSVTPLPLGSGIKFVYDGILINFSIDGQLCFLDQILPTDLINSLPSPYVANNNTLSLTSIQTIGTNQFIRITHPNHNLELGDMVQIDLAVNTNNTPETVINNLHPIHKILDRDTYMLRIRPHQPFVVKDIVMQGEVIVTFPIYFQLLFDKLDTVGPFLGFDIIGSRNAKTSYRKVILNTELYETEAGCQEVTNRLIRLEPILPSYFFLCIEELPTYRNCGLVRSVYTKVRIVELNQVVHLIDTFVPVICFCEPIIGLLPFLRVSIRWPNGDLVDFGNQNHSFTLVMTELQARPEETGISARLNTEIVTRQV